MADEQPAPITTDPMSTAGPISETQRAWDRLWLAVVPVTLVVATVLMLVRSDASAGHRAVTVAIAGAAGGWQWWMVSRHPHWVGRLGPMSGAFVVLLGLTAVLIERDVAYLVVAFGCYPPAFVLLPGGWAYLGVAAVTGTVIGTNILGSDRVDVTDQVLVAAVGLAVPSLIGAAIRAQEATSSRMLALSARNAELQAELTASARRAGALAERHRLAREIHDTVAQGLIGIVTQLDAAEVAGSDAERTRRLTAAAGLARDSLTEARRSVQALRPGPLAGGGLDDAVRGAVDDFTVTTGIEATLTLTGDSRRLPSDVEDAVLRIVQEALANVAKHANARRVGVTLSYMDDLVVLDVRDDGCGIDMVRRPSAEGGFGLVAMRQRLAGLSGRLELESAPGHGTALSASVPLPGGPA